jgi:peptide/nickel transport system permease protein
MTKVVQANNKNHPSKSLLFSIGFLGLVILMALFADWLSPFPQDAGDVMHFGQKLRAPSAEHFFGTDSYGRDLFTLIIFGARLSLIAAIGVVGLALFIGVPLGLIAGYAGGLTENIIMRVCDVFLAFPPLLLPVLLTAALGPNLQNAVIAVAISWFPWYTRILRAEVIVVKQMPYVAASKCAGASTSRLLLQHILPNSFSPILVQVALDMGYAILAVAGLSFIGFGARPPAIEWGLMITSSRAVFLDYWWTAVFPGLALFLTVLAFNLGGEGLRKLLKAGDSL